MKPLQYILLFLAACWASCLAFIAAPVADGLGESSRILYLHVPAAWIAVLSFTCSGIFAALHLIKGEEHFARLMHGGAELGILFITSAAVSGAVWAHEAWGVFWNWDPRETSVMLILLIYIGYFAIPSTSKKRAYPRAGYLVISALVMPIFIFVIPRMYPSLHPAPLINTKGVIHLDPLMRGALLSSLGLYTILFVIIYRLQYRISSIKSLIEETP